MSETKSNDNKSTDIKFDEFAKVELKVGEILSAEKVEGSDKLLKLSVDFNEPSPRQVISGIAKAFQPEDWPKKLIGKQFLFVTNLEPRTIFNLESQAMILATAVQKKNKEDLVLMKPAKKVPPGSALR